MSNWSVNTHGKVCTNLDHCSVMYIDFDDGKWFIVGVLMSGKKTKISMESDSEQYIIDLFDRITSDHIQL